MRIARSAFSVLLLSVALLTPACDASTSPSDISAVFALVSVSGHALPTAASSHSDLIVVADTIRMREDGTGFRVLVTRNGVGGRVERSRETFTWTASADTIAISFPCNDVVLASCLAPPHLVGRLGHGQQWVLDRAGWFDLPAVYNRVGFR